MGFSLGTLFKGLLGFATGGPVGAAAGVASDLLGGGGQQAQAHPRAGVTLAPLATSQAPAQSPAYQTGALQGMIDSLAEAMVARSQGYDENAALGMPVRRGMRQVANRRGGMASPSATTLPRPEWGFGGGRGGGGDGKGAGALGARYSTWWPGTMRPAAALTPAATMTPESPTIAANPFAAYQAVPNLTGGLMGGFQAYMQKALAGQNTLPEASYQQAMSRGMQSLGTQAQVSRENLGEQLGARGLLHSGLMARGLRGVEEARLGGVGDLVSGLNQQNLQAARESQQAAMQQMVPLAGIEQSGRENAIRGILALKQLELQAQQLGINKEQFDAAQDAVRMGQYADIGQALASYFWPAKQAAASTGQTQISGAGNYYALGPGGWE